MRRLLLAIALASATASSAAARSEKTLAYARDHAWPTAVRFVAVDESAKILEKDGDAGYVLFEIKDQGKLYRGSLELVTVTVNGQPNVKLVVTLVDRPSWMEVAMLTRLEQKLRADLGSPNPAPSKPRDDKPNDKPKDSDKPDGDKKPDKPGDPPAISRPL
ncbi:MAG TPA: hypothetical protein VFQ53_27200 [Kofleriaceae bacterium]|nr:hypothetical protein [Kofleriaceae bacterium]